MTSFVLANLLDVPYLSLTQTVTGTSSILEPGFILVKQTAAATLTLASGLQAPTIIKDVSGNANKWPITIVAAGGATFDGAASFTIAIPYQWIWVIWNGTNYSVVG